MAGLLGRSSSLIVLAFGATVMVLSLRMGLGDLRKPGPGMWPFVASAILVVAALCHTVVQRGDDAEPMTRRSLLVAVGIASLVGYINAFVYIGFAVPTLLVLAFWLRVIAGESWRLTLVLSFVLTAAFYVLFVVLLGVPFPEGPLTPLVP